MEEKVLERFLTIEPIEIPHLGLYLTKMEYFDVRGKYRQELTNLRLRILNEERAVDELIKDMLNHTYQSDTYDLEGVFHSSAGHILGNSGSINWSEIKRNKKREIQRVLMEEGFSGEVHPNEGWLDLRPYIRFYYFPNKPNKIFRKIRRMLSEKYVSDRCW